MIITNEQYYQCVVGLRKYKDKEQYIEAVLKTKEWRSGEDGGTDEDRREMCSIIYDAGHRTVAEISRATGFSIRQLALRFGFSYNTLLHWADGTSEPAYSVYLMLQELMELIVIPRE